MRKESTTFHPQVVGGPTARLELVAVTRGPQFAAPGAWLQEVKRLGRPAEEQRPMLSQVPEPQGMPMASGLSGEGLSSEGALERAESRRGQPAQALLAPEEPAEMQGARLVSLRSQAR